jgi:hypothetical protein
VLPLQQPFGQDPELHTHCPAALHVWPDAHAAHAAPPAPQDIPDSIESARHVPALQQPAHEAPPHEHAPPEHDSPLPHAPHVPPPVPHADGPCTEYGMQVAPLQQPSGHELALHTHCPVIVSHAWPVAHAPHA